MLSRGDVEMEARETWLAAVLTKVVTLLTVTLTAVMEVLTSSLPPPHVQTITNRTRQEMSAKWGW